MPEATLAELGIKALPQDDSKLGLEPGRSKMHTSVPLAHQPYPPTTCFRAG